jgi:hypothetical protein
MKRLLLALAALLPATAWAQLTPLGMSGNAPPAAASALTAETSRAQAAEALLAPLISPVFMGNPVVPGYLTTSSASATYAPLASPALTGAPTVPTAASGTNTTQAASTAFTTGAIATETTRATTAEGSLLAKSGDASAATIAPPGSSTARSLAARAVDVYYARDSGADPTGATDATVALQAWMNAAAAAGAQRFVIGTEQYLIGSANLIVPAGLTVQGPWGRPGRIAGDNYTSVPGSLIVAPSYTVQMSQGSALDGLIVRCQGVVQLNGNNLAYAQIANMAGTGITVGLSNGSNTASGVTLRNLMVLGFNLGINSNGNDRLYIEDVAGDNINGIRIQQSFDISQVVRVHFWPFLTVGGGVNHTNVSISTASIVSGYWQIVTASAHGFSTGQTVVVAGNSQTQINGYWTVTVINPTTLQIPVTSGSGTGTGGTVYNTVLLRPGIAFEVPQNDDHGIFEDDFSYGYATGFKITNSMHNVLHGIGADNDGLPDVGDWGAVGIDLEGTTSNASLTDCKASAQHTGVLVNTPGNAHTAVNCQQWGNFLNHVSVTAGGLALIGNRTDGGPSVQLYAASGQNLTYEGGYLGSTPLVTADSATKASIVRLGIPERGFGPYYGDNGSVALSPHQNTTATGNQLGSNAVDLETCARTNAIHVASGQNALAAGCDATASNTGSVALGTSVTASGVQATAIGNSTTATGQRSTVLGAQSMDRGGYARLCYAGTAINVQGDEQTCWQPIFATTTAAASATLTADRNAPSSSNILNLPNNGAYAFGRIVVLAYDSAGNHACEWFIDALLAKRGASASLTTIVGSPTITIPQCDSALSSAGLSALSVTVAADTTNGGVAIGVTGVAGYNLTWRAAPQSTEGQ